MASDALRYSLGLCSVHFEGCQVQIDEDFEYSPRCVLYEIAPPLVGSVLYESPK